MTLSVALNKHHVRLTKETGECLFGIGHDLTPQGKTPVPGVFRAAEFVRVQNYKGELIRVPVFGPYAEEDLVVLPRSEARKIGTKAPVADEQEPGIGGFSRVVGPEGHQDVPEGTIVPYNSILLPLEEEYTSLYTEGQTVSVSVMDDVRPLTLQNIPIHFAEGALPCLLLDPDTASACDAGKTTKAEIL